MDPLLRRDLLFDAYHSLLTGRQKLAFELHHHDDLSFGEMAAELHISRAAALDLLRRGEATLREAEDKIGFVAHQLEDRKCGRDLEKLLQEHRYDEALRRVKRWLDGEGDAADV